MERAGWSNLSHNWNFSRTHLKANLHESIVYWFTLHLFSLTHCRKCNYRLIIKLPFYNSTSDWLSLQPRAWGVVPAWLSRRRRDPGSLWKPLAEKDLITLLCLWGCCLWACLHFKEQAVRVSSLTTDPRTSFWNTLPPMKCTILIIS